MKVRVVGFSILGAAVLVAGGLALFALEFPRVRNNDMAPGLRQGDLLLACRICGVPQTGDVVVVSNADEADPERMSIRRVAAGPGDKIEVKKGQVLVNDRPLTGEKLDEIELANVDDVSSAPRKFEVWSEALGKHQFSTLRDKSVAPSGDVPAETLKNSYFLLADRRTFARDSRNYG